MTGPKRTLTFRTVGDSMIVLRENKDTPRDEDWDAFLACLVENRARFSQLKILVMTEGGGPNVEQRKRLEVALDRRPVRVAVVTDSIKVRFIVSSIALLNRQISTFSLKEIERAYTHLGMTQAEQSLARAVIRELDQQVEF